MTTAGKLGDDNGIEGSSPGSWKRYRCAVTRGTTVSGELFFDYPVRLEGSVGITSPHAPSPAVSISTVSIPTVSIPTTVFSTAGIAVTREAEINAQLRADTVVIEGKLSGEVIAARRVEILAGAVVHGRVKCPDFVLHEGAIFEGDLITQPRL